MPQRHPKDQQTTPLTAAPCPLAWRTRPACVTRVHLTPAPVHNTACCLPACLVSSAAAAGAGTKSAVEGVKGVGEGVKKAGETVANVGKSAAGFANPAVGVFAAAGFGSLLLLAL